MILLFHVAYAFFTHRNREQEGRRDLDKDCHNASTAHCDTEESTSKGAPIEDVGAWSTA